MLHFHLQHYKQTANKRTLQIQIFIYSYKVTDRTSLTLWNCLTTVCGQWCALHPTINTSVSIQLVKTTIKTLLIPLLITLVTNMHSLAQLPTVTRRTS